MRQRSIFHRLTSLMTSRPSRSVGVAFVALLVAGTPAAAVVTLSASRTELLYSTDVNPDCSKLFPMDDTQLPFNITRVIAVVPNAPAGRQLSYRWSLRKPAVGTLAANLPIGTSGGASAVSGMCADFGNACLLTGDKLRFYNESSILWIAPTCDVLPKDTSKPFRGGVGRIRVKVSDGRRKVGSATVTIGFGRNGSVTLFMTDIDGNFEDGLRKHQVPTGFAPVFAATVDPPTFTPGPGPVMKFIFDNGGGAGATVDPGCPFPGFDACKRLDYASGGRFLANVAAKFEDGSALCDNLTALALTCNPSGRVEIIPRPRLATYDPASPRSTVDLIVRLHNTSTAKGGLPACPFQLGGAGVLTCSEGLSVGGVKDSKSTSFDLPHCSVATDRPCADDAQCPTGETCLTQPHCSMTLTQQCGNDADCDSTGQPPRCPNCKPDETCIRVLELGAGMEPRVNPGHSIELFHQTVKLRDDLPSTAKMVDTWTAKTENAGSYDGTLKYRIRGRPGR